MLDTAIGARPSRAQQHPQADQPRNNRAHTAYRSLLRPGTGALRWQCQDAPVADHAPAAGWAAPASLRGFMVESLKIGNPPVSSRAAPSWMAIRRKPNSAKNLWISSIPPLAAIGSGAYRLSRTTTTNPRGVFRLRNNFTTAARVNVLGRTVCAPATPVISGLMNEIEFHD